MELWTVLAKSFPFRSTMFEGRYHRISDEWIGKQSIMARVAEPSHVPNCGALPVPHIFCLFIEIVQTIEHQNLWINGIPLALLCSNISHSLAWIHINAELKLLLQFNLVLALHLAARHLDLSNSRPYLRVLYMISSGFLLSSVRPQRSSIVHVTLTICKPQVCLVKWRRQFHEGVTCSSECGDLSWSFSHYWLPHQVLDILQLDVNLRWCDLFAYILLCLKCPSDCRLFFETQLLPDTTKLVVALNNFVYFL